MANPEHFEIIKQGVVAWNKWRQENTEIMPQLGMADLRKANLRNADLREADLQEAHLQKANFNGANLQGANLEKADLQGAKFQGANLQKVNLLMAHLEEADMAQSCLESITLGVDSLRLIPIELKARYGGTFVIVGLTESVPGRNTIIRSIEFPPEYHQAGVSILNYFGTVLRQKYPDKKVKVRIEQEGLKVTMIVETEEGDREIIEKALDQYGLVVLDQIPASKLLEDPLQAMALENKVEMAKIEIRQAYKLLDFSKGQYEKRIETLEEDLRWLRQHVGGLLLHSGELVGVAKKALRRDQGFLKDIAGQSLNIRHELSTLASKLDTLRSAHEDIEEVKLILLSVRQKEPGKYEKIKEYFSELAIGATGSIYATVICEALKLIQ